MLNTTSIQGYIECCEAIKEADLSMSTQLIKNIHITEISYFDPGQKIINLDGGLFQNVQRSGEIKNIDILISLDNSGFLYEILELKSNLQFEINQRFSENITITFKGENIE